MLNSLYGKFGQREDAGLRRLVKLEEELDEETWEGADVFRLGDEVYLLKPIRGSGEPPFVNLLWAGYISSYARLKLFDALEQSDFSAVYVDTDSVFTDHDLQVGERLGDLAVKDANVGLRILAPKAYWVEDAQGDITPYCKGLPAEAKVAFLTTGEANYQKPLGILEARVRGDAPSRWVTVTKHALWDKEKREYYRLPGMRAGVYASRPWAVHALP